jgi:hypothetical protein
MAEFLNYFKLTISDPKMKYFWCYVVSVYSFAFFYLSLAQNAVDDTAFYGLSPPVYHSRKYFCYISQRAYFD